MKPPPPIEAKCGRVTDIAKAVATAAGLFDGAQYVAGAIVAQTLGHVIDKFGWSAWGITQVPFAVVGAMLIATLWNARPQGKPAH